MVSVEKRLKMPAFIKTYLMGRLCFNLAIALAGLILAALLFPYMANAEPENFLPSPPVVYAEPEPEEEERGVWDFQAAHEGQREARERALAEHRARTNYATTMFIANLLAYTSAIVFLIFGCRALLIWLNIRGSRWSTMYRVLVQWGEPQALLDRLDPQLLNSNDMRIDKDFVLLALATHVYIAPAEELLWAYGALLVSIYPSGSRYGGTRAHTAHMVRLHFSNKEMKSIKVDSQSGAVGLLNTIKRANPNAVLGFRHELLRIFEMYHDPKREIEKNLERLQERSVLQSQANIRRAFWIHEEYLS